MGNQMLKSLLTALLLHRVSCDSPELLERTRLFLISRPTTSPNPKPGPAQPNTVLWNTFTFLEVPVTTIPMSPDDQTTLLRMTTPSGSPHVLPTCIPRPLFAWIQFCSMTRFCGPA